MLAVVVVVIVMVAVLAVPVVLILVMVVVAVRRAVVAGGESSEDAVAFSPWRQRASDTDGGAPCIARETSEDACVSWTQGWRQPEQSSRHRQRPRDMRDHDVLFRGRAWVWPLRAHSWRT